MINSFAAIMGCVISIASLNAVANSKELTVTNNEINSAKSLLLNTDFDNYSVDDFEDKIKSNLIKYYDTHTEYVGSSVYYANLKSFLKEKDYAFVEMTEFRAVNNRVNLTYAFDGGGDGGGSIPVSTMFEKRENDDSNATALYVPTMNNRTFVGLNLSKEACVGVYNFVADIVNNFNEISELVKLAKATTLSTIVTFIETLTFKLVDKIAHLLTLIPPGPLGKAVKVVLVVVGIAAAVVLASAFAFGMFGKGYYIGFAMYGIFDWRYEFGLYE